MHPRIPLAFLAARAHCCHARMGRRQEFNRFYTLVCCTYWPGKERSLGFACEKEKRKVHRIGCRWWGSALATPPAQTRPLKPLQPCSEVWRGTGVFLRPCSALVRGGTLNPGLRWGFSPGGTRRLEQLQESNGGLWDVPCLFLLIWWRNWGKSIAKAAGKGCLPERKNN